MAGGRVELLAGPAGRACFALPVPVAVQLTGSVPRPPAQGIRISVSVGVHTSPWLVGISFRDTLLRLWMCLWVWRLCLWIKFAAGNPCVGCCIRLVCVPVRKRKRVKRKRCPAWGRPDCAASSMLLWATELARAAAGRAADGTCWVGLDSWEALAPPTLRYKCCIRWP